MNISKTKVETLTKLKAEVKQFVLLIDVDNFHRSYQPLVQILKPYRGKGLRRESVTKVLIEVQSEIEMDDYREDVLDEMNKRLEGFASTKKNVGWF
ncbi:MAG: hypothetical protein R8G66_17855 [Cytophagales bacterium]|nr:hypothetical protein [Cytophagales bacterium]